MAKAAQRAQLSGKPIVGRRACRTRHQTARRPLETLFSMLSYGRTTERGRERRRGRLLLVGPPQGLIDLLRLLVRPVLHVLKIGEHAALLLLLDGPLSVVDGLGLGL